MLFTHIIFMVFGYEFLVRTLKTSFVIEENDEETKFIPSPLSTISYIIEIYFFYLILPDNIYVLVYNILLCSIDVYTNTSIYVFIIGLQQMRFKWQISCHDPSLVQRTFFLSFFLSLFFFFLMSLVSVSLFGCHHHNLSFWSCFLSLFFLSFFLS